MDQLEVLLQEQGVGAEGPTQRADVVVAAELWPCREERGPEVRPPSAQN